jgi:hypothetical protein
LIKVQDLFKAALRHDEDLVDELRLGDHGNFSEDIDIEMVGGLSTKSADLSAKLRKIMDSIDAKLTCEFLTNYTLTGLLMCLSLE